MPNIDLLASVKQHSRTNRAGVTSSKFSLEFKVQGEAIVHLDDKELAAQLAVEVLRVTKEALAAGLAPDGAALPPLSSATIARREREAAQGARSGALKPAQSLDVMTHTGQEALLKRIPRGAKAVANYARDYAPPRGLAGPFVPQTGLPRGNVSGILLNSMTVRSHRNGRGWSIYVAGVRGNDRGGTSALSSTYAGTDVGAAVQSMINAPAGQEMLSGIGTTTVASSIAQLLGNAKRTAALLSGLRGGD